MKGCASLFWQWMIHESEVLQSWQFETFRLVTYSGLIPSGIIMLVIFSCFLTTFTNLWQQLLTPFILMYFFCWLLHFILFCLHMHSFFRQFIILHTASSCSWSNGLLLYVVEGKIQNVCKFLHMVYCTQTVAYLHIFFSHMCLLFCLVSCNH